MAIQFTTSQLIQALGRFETLPIETEDRYQDCENTAIEIVAVYQPPEKHKLILLRDNSKFLEPVWRVTAVITPKYSYKDNELKREPNIPYLHSELVYDTDPKIALRDELSWYKLHGHTVEEPQIEAVPNPAIIIRVEDL